MTIENHLSRNATLPDISLIPLDQLGISIPHLVRPLDEQYVAELVQTDESAWEPIEVRKWPATWQKPSPAIVYHVMSGNHRTSAAQIKKLPALPARIIEADDDLSYMIAAIRTNARHGRNFTEDDRRALAARLKGLGQSADQIAALFNVNRATVYNWLSGRDSNASKKRAHDRKAAGMQLLAEAEAGLVDNDWATLPDTSVDARQLLQARRQIIDFLRTPAVLEKSQVVSLIRSLDDDDRASLLVDAREAERWSRNVRALLENGGRGSNAN